MPVTVSPGDEGGALPAGLSTGAIGVGDLDVWTVSASAGNSVIVSMSETAVGQTLQPWLRLYGPTGTLLQTIYGASHAQLSVTAPSTGTYLVVAADASSGLGGTGNYWITPSAASGVDAPARPLELALSAGGPNPFAGRTTLRYALPHDGPVSLRLFDAQGRLVRTLADGGSEAGEHTATWDGRDAGGGRANPGVYLARLEADGRRLVQRVVLVR